MGNFAWGMFLLGGGNLTMSDFDHSNLFQSLKQHFVDTERQQKSKLAWPVCTKGMKLKEKWCKRNNYS